MSPWNQVVAYHEIPEIALLAVVNENGLIDQDLFHQIKYSFSTPMYYFFSSLKEIESFLEELERKSDPMEGFVITDNTGLKLKIKSKYYLRLHRLSGNGNIGLTKNIIPIILNGEEEEVISYFPNLKPRIVEVTNLLQTL